MPAGKVPVERERFTILVMVGTSGHKTFLRRKVGTGSRRHDLVGDAMMKFFTIFSETGTKIKVKVKSRNRKI
jgi:hypothetical protein